MPLHTPVTSSRLNGIAFYPHPIEMAIQRSSLTSAPDREHALGLHIKSISLLLHHTLYTPILYPANKITKATRSLAYLLRLLSCTKFTVWHKC